MSDWNIGLGDVTEEAQALKDKFASKDGQIAAQQTQLLKQAAELNELKVTLNEAIHKLQYEADKALKLENDIQHCSEDLRNERISSLNTQSSLAAANQSIKAKDLEVRELQATLETISHTSNGHNARSLQLEKEKAILSARVRELEENLRKITCPPTTPAKNTMSRPRSSSLSNFRITTLEQELLDIRSLLSKNEAELLSTSQKLTQNQYELIKVGNEKLAMERKMDSQIAELHRSIEEKDEELSFLRVSQGDCSREEELLRRIEEDDARIAALEIMIREAPDVKDLKKKLSIVEQHLNEERRKAADVENRQTELIWEKEEALDKLKCAQEEMSKLEDHLKTDHTNNNAQPQRTAFPVDPSSEDAVNSVERLLSAIDRLRGERDGLRLDLQFLETESRFTIEALESKLKTYDSQRKIPMANEQVNSEVEKLRIQSEKADAVRMATLRTKETDLQRLNLLATALATAVGHLQSQAELKDRQIDDFIRARPDFECQLREIEDRMDVTILCLEATTSQRDDLLTQLGSKNAEWEEKLETAQAAHQETRDRFENINQRLDEVANQLEGVESERNSLALQVTNLTTDLQNAQNELSNAESRYTSLQFHQLSNMSSNEATSALREQIQELEQRVVRRTEQIGIHQHDIRRLETNLRLQEERLSEMTMDLEMLGAQKDAMVEDCADARDARDAALERVEALEDEIEIIEKKLNDRESAMESLVGVVIQTVNNARAAIRTRDGLVLQAQDNCAAIEDENQSSLNLLRQRTMALEAAKQESQSLVQDIRQATTALAVFHVDVDKMMLEKQTRVKANVALRLQVESLQTNASSLMSELDSLRNNSTRRSLDISLRSAELQNEVTDLKRTLDETDVKHQVALDDLRNENSKLLYTMEEKNRTITLKLVDATNAHQQLQARYDTAELDHQKAMSASRQSMNELEERLKVATEDSVHTSDLKKQLELAREQFQAQLSHSEERLAAATQDAEEVRKSCDVLRAQQQQLVDDFAAAKSEYGIKIAHLEDELDTAQKGLISELSELQATLNDQASKLELSVEEVARLTLELQEVSNCRARDQDQHISQLQAVQKRLEQAEEESQTVQQDASIIRSKFEQSEEEKLALQQETTELEAEIQRSISLNRYLESQIKESEHVTSALKTNLEQFQAALARSEQAAKAAEVNLSLQSAQHRREMAELQRELSVIRGRPDLEGVVAELEERISEMEEQMRAKCAEIEENDDRALEMMKENKKLSAKAESLSRKVQNLQAKLVTAKASIPKASSPIVGPSPNDQPLDVSDPSRWRSTQPSAPPIPIFPPQHPVSVTQAPSAISSRRSVTQTSAPSSLETKSRVSPSPHALAQIQSNQMASGSSIFPRSGTPERKTPYAPVFKARTPERLVIDISPPATMIGKKRRAPDDFEACESVPLQAFTAESVPREDTENRTPRVRRVFGRVQSGFTPLRNQGILPSFSIPSPKRAGSVAATAPILIADVTNSPRANSRIPPVPLQSTKPTKKTWLGRIKVASSQTSGRPTSKTMFDNPHMNS